MIRRLKTIFCLIFLLSSETAFAILAGTPFVYKTVAGRDLSLYVLKPNDWKKSDSRPAMVFFHGGGWTRGGPATFTEQARYLTSRGMVTLRVEYRLLEQPSDSPEVCIQDARSAMRWVRGHAEDLGINPERIASAGESAGGHLAAFVGMMDGFDEPQDNTKISPKSNAMFLFNPVLDNGPDGWAHRRVGERYKVFSPFYNVTAKAPPAVVFLGTEDQLIPVKTIEEFRTRMEACGVRCDAHFYAGEKHSFFSKEPWRTTTLIEVDRFLIDLGWLTGVPQLTVPEQQ